MSSSKRGNSSGFEKEGNLPLISFSCMISGQQLLFSHMLIKYILSVDTHLSLHLYMCMYKKEKFPTLDLLIAQQAKMDLKSNVEL